MVDIAPINADDRELMAAPPIGESLPCKIGTFTLEMFTGHCAKCDREILPGRFRGRVNAWDGRAEIIAIGVCPECNLATRFRHRIHSDGTIVGRRKDGMWCRWSMKSRWEKLWDSLRRVFAPAERRW